MSQAQSPAGGDADPDPSADIVPDVPDPDDSSDSANSRGDAAADNDSAENDSNENHSGAERPDQPPAGGALSGGTVAGSAGTSDPMPDMAGTGGA